MGFTMVLQWCHCKISPTLRCRHLLVVILIRKCACRDLRVLCTCDMRRTNFVGEWNCPCGTNDIQFVSFASSFRNFFFAVSTPMLRLEQRNWFELYWCSIVLTPLNILPVAQTCCTLVDYKMKQNYVNPSIPKDRRIGIEYSKNNC